MVLPRNINNVGCTTVYRYINLMYLFEAISFIIKTCLMIYAQMHALGTESVFIGFAIHKIINWNPESTAAPESKMWNPESKA